MQQEIYKLLVLAIACEIPTDDAYLIMSVDFLAEFRRYYENIKATKEPQDCPSTVDALINYTIIRLPSLRDGFADTSILYNLRSRRNSIIKSFLYSDVSTMVCRLASRQTILDAVKSFLIHENSFSSIYSKINSSRVSVIFTQFLEVFKANSAHAFEFEGDFKEFVMFSFINYFYKGRKKDVWAYIREVDDAKWELEHSIVTEKTITVNRNDDLKIHDLLVNINEVNDKLFKHSGQDDEVFGVLYDIYYLILCELCSRKVKEINDALGDEILIFVDPKDRKRNWFGMVPNKGIHAKVQNAKELITYIFDYVRSGRLNVSSFADLRIRCFDLGKHDCEGRNCVWELLPQTGETAHYLDTDKARRNYDTFNKLLKGVISVYTLMTELEGRGHRLVAEYNPDLFQDSNLIRYIDYLSAVEHIDLIRKLQEQPIDKSQYNAELLEFPEMVNVYAGSEDNKHANIKENRYHAITRGFFDKFRLKQTDIPKTPFEKLSLVARSLNAIPHSYFEYVMSLNANYIKQYAFTSWIALPPSAVVEGRYFALYYNQYMRTNPKMAEYYLEGSERLKAIGSGLLYDFSWNVGSSCTTTIALLGSLGVWLPIERKFFMYSVPEDFGQSGFLASPTEITAIVNQSAVNGIPQTRVAFSYSPIQANCQVAEWVEKMGDSIGFPVQIGISNFISPDILSTIPKAKMLGVYRRYVVQYYTWMHENSVMQHSIIDVLSTMYREALYWVNLGYDTGILPAHAQNLLTGLQTGEFNAETLNWFLQLLYKDTSATDCDYDPSRGNQQRPLDRLVLDYCFGNVPEKNGVQLFYEDCAGIVELYETPAERFIAIYNHVCTKLEFLMLFKDSMSLMLTTIPMEAPALVCEFSARFNVPNTLQKYAQSPITFGARLWSQTAESVKAIITETRISSMAAFKALLDFFISFIRESEEEIAKLVNYNVTSQGDIASRFSSWGETFTIMPQYNGVLELDLLRTMAITDDAGFFVMNGVYFKGHNNNIDYYVHRSGRLLAEVSGKFEPMTFDLEKEKDKRLYRDILAKGFENGR